MTSRTRWRTAIVTTLALLSPGIAFFGKALVEREQFACRDASHYYPPLFKTVHRQWKHDGWPVWNPLEERGRPLLADPTASVYYPGQLVFWLPFDFSFNFTLYLVFHVTLCLATAFCAARGLGCRVATAALAAISYAYGGSVIFQHANPPYLVGAAWLPLGIDAARRCFVGDKHVASATLGIVLALMVLGGDPETAYLLGLGTVLLAAFASIPLIGHAPSTLLIRGTISNVVTLCVAGLLGFGLSAAQWMPTVAWARQSDRAAVINSDVALRSAGSRSDSSDTNNLDVTSPSEPAHDVKRYWFSVGPWRWPELLWPNFSGKPFPQNSRWISAIPQEGRFWTPSLYMGVIPIMLALSGLVRSLSFRTGRLAHRWLSWLALIGIFASLGRYGGGWLLRELAGAAGTGVKPTLADETGGMYWLFVNGLPGFAAFRYPAKTWTFFALCMSLLGAIQLEDACRQRLRPLSTQWLKRYRRLCAGLFIGVAAVYLSGKLPLPGTFPNDSLFGPLQWKQVFTGLMQSTLHGLLLATIAICLQARFYESSTGISANRLAFSLLVVTAVDVTFANRWLIPTVPTSTYAFAKMPERIRPGDLVYRQRNQAWYPRAWSHTTSAERFAACVRWDRRTAKPKYPQQNGVGSLHSATSFSSRHQLALLAVLSGYRQADPDAFTAILRRLGVDWYCEPDDATLDIGARLANDATEGGLPIRMPTERVNYWPVSGSLGACWFSQAAIHLPGCATTAAASELQQMTRVALRPTVSDQQFVSTVVIESSREVFAAAVENGNGDRSSSQMVDVQNAPAPSGVSCELVERSSSRLKLKANTDVAGWVVINEMFAPGWTATVTTAGETRPAAVLRANRVMCAVRIPAGGHDVEFQYRAPYGVPGLTISLLTLLMLILGVGRFLLPTKSAMRLWFRLKSDSSSQDQDHPSDPSAPSSLDPLARP